MDILYMCNKLKSTNISTKSMYFVFPTKATAAKGHSSTNIWITGKNNRCGQQFNNQKVKKQVRWMCTNIVSSACESFPVSISCVCLCLSWSVCVSWLISPLAVGQHVYVFVKQTVVLRNPTTLAPQLLCHCQILSAALTFCHWLCVLGCQIEGGLYHHSSHPVRPFCQWNYAEESYITPSSIYLCILSSFSSSCPTVSYQTS